MEITFTGEDDDGNNVVYANWRELASAEPRLLIDVETLTVEQATQLASELEPYAQSVESKVGDEVSLIPRYWEDGSALGRFSWANLPRLRPDSFDSLIAHERQAQAFVVDAIGGFRGISGTLVRGQDETWEIVRTVKAEPKERQAAQIEYLNAVRDDYDDEAWKHLCDCAGVTTGTVLEQLFTEKLAPPLSKIWHAVRVLVHVRLARQAIDGDNAYLACASGVVVGESIKALSMKVARSGAGGQRGKGKSSQKKYEVFQAEADEIWRGNSTLKKSDVAMWVKNRLASKASTSTIRQNIKKPTMTE